jgi:hypothetical protein
MRKLTLILAAGAALLLAGCGTKPLEIIPGGAETAIRNAIKQHTGLPATNVRCPSGVHAKAGNTFACHFSAGGQNYIAHMHILRIKGHAVTYDVTTSPA